MNIATPAVIGQSPGCEITSMKMPMAPKPSARHAPRLPPPETDRSPPAHHAGAARTASGFTLVEILVATTILLVVGGAAGSLILQAFTLWEHGVGRTRRLAATDTVATRIARDFASAQAGLGCSIGRGRCRFWTIEAPGTRPPRLIEVDYAIGPDAVTRRTVTADQTAVQEDRYAPVEPLTLDCASTRDPPGTWRETWDSPTNAPSRLRLRLSDPQRAALLMLRRTP